MKTVIVTGAAGLIGSESVKRFAREGFKIVGIDNDLRQWFFGKEASTLGNRQKLIQSIPNYEHHDFDIRDRAAVENLFQKLGQEVALIIHTAAQPSHDWAARDPHADFGVNAVGTLNLLQAAREFCPEAVFIFTSTNKVYGDTPNRLPLVELEKRWEIQAGHEYEPGISETMSIDQTKHSLFGASKVAADVLVQEYGNYFGMKTACFRGGCLTGPAHAGTELHGFLAYLMRCTVAGHAYRVSGYKGKQVADNIHSDDPVEAFWQFFEAVFRRVDGAMVRPPVAIPRRRQPRRRRVQPLHHYITELCELREGRLGSGRLGRRARAVFGEGKTSEPATISTSCSARLTRGRTPSTSARP